MAKNRIAGVSPRRGVGERLAIWIRFQVVA
jgi:hypothetical protein